MDSRQNYQVINGQPNIQQNYPQNFTSINPQTQYVQNSPNQFSNFQPIYNIPPQYQQQTNQYPQAPNQQYAYRNIHPLYSQYSYGQQGNSNGYFGFNPQQNMNQFQGQNYPQNVYQVPHYNQAYQTNNNMNQGKQFTYSNQNYY